MSHLTKSRTLEICTSRTTIFVSASQTHGSTSGGGAGSSLSPSCSAKLACNDSTQKGNGTFPLFPSFDLLFSPFLTCRDYWWGHLPIPYLLSNSRYRGKHPAKAGWMWSVSSAPGSAPSPAGWIWRASSAYVVWTSGRHPSCSAPGCTSLCLRFSGPSSLRSLAYWSKYPWEKPAPRAEKQSELCHLPKADEKAVWSG